MSDTRRLTALRTERTAAGASVAVDYALGEGAATFTTVHTMAGDGSADVSGLLTRSRRHGHISERDIRDFGTVAPGPTPIASRDNAPDGARARFAR